MSESFGSGISLDEKLDFEVDETGDIKAERGIDELQRTLRFR
jgi:hypothetical protein